MTAEQFCFWLQGALELSRVTEFDISQIEIIQDHLDLVFKKETPIRDQFGVKLQDVVDKHKDTLVHPFEFPKPYIGLPPFDLKNPPLITC